MSKELKWHGFFLLRFSLTSQSQPSKESFQMGFDFLQDVADQSQNNVIESYGPQPSTKYDSNSNQWHRVASVLGTQSLIV